MGTEATARSGSQPALIRAVGLSKSYVQRPLFLRRKFVMDALENVDLEVAPASLTALVGASGSGKSTLAGCMALLEKPDQGEIWFEEQEVSRLSEKALACLRPRIQMVHQD